MMPLQQAIEDACERALPNPIDPALAERIARAAIRQLLGHDGYDTALGIDESEERIANYYRNGWMPIRRTVRSTHVETMLARPAAYARLSHVATAALRWRETLITGTSTAGQLATEQLCEALDEWEARDESE